MIGAASADHEDRHQKNKVSIWKDLNEEFTENIVLWGGVGSPAGYIVCGI
jgi:hypothetical protein